MVLSVKWVMNLLEWRVCYYCFWYKGNVHVLYSGNIPIVHPSCFYTGINFYITSQKHDNIRGARNVDVADHYQKHAAAQDIQLFDCSFFFKSVIKSPLKTCQPNHTKLTFSNLPFFLLSYHPISA